MNSPSSEKMEARVITNKNKFPKAHLVASISQSFAHKTIKSITSMKQGIQSNGATSDIVFFLVTTAALEAVRRISKAKCPFIWRGLQTLQVLCYPPFKWLQKWPLFKTLSNHVQKYSRPMLFLSIATVFSDEPEYKPDASGSFRDPEPQSQSDPSSSHFSSSIMRSNDEWLIQLHNELQKEGMTLHERLDEDELRRLHKALNGDFARLLTSVKRTIRWRQTYTIFSPEELEIWSNVVFWHGSDSKLRPCLIIRLGLACSNLRSEDRPLFVKAIVSQIEQGIINLVSVEHPQITVLMDCQGLSPFGFPVQTLRSCAILLQEHYPNRLGSLIIVRLPQVARLVTQTLFQVLQPATRQKLRIVGGNYQVILSEYLESRPSFLGGNCTCPKCLDSEANVEIVRDNITLLKEGEDVVNGDTHLDMEIRINGKKEQLVRIVIIGILMLGVFAGYVLAMFYLEK